MTHIGPNPAQEAIADAARWLKAGGVVALPTETVYGLAANALDAVAVRRIFTIKGRPLIDPLIVHVHDLAQIADLAEAPDEQLWKLAEAFWPGPLTVVLRKTARVPSLVTADNPTVALRMPAHAVMRAVLQACGLPLAAPSANPFGYVSPTTAEHVRESLGGRVDAIVDGGPTAHGIESTILDLSRDAPEVLRLGPIAPEVLSDVLGQAVAVRRGHAERPDAPGMLARHYSPRAPFRVFGNGAAPPPDLPPGAAILWQGRPDAARKPARDAQHFWLSEDGNPAEAARNLFALMRRLDALAPPVIAAELAPETGLGAALNDRLQRAAVSASPSA